MARRAILEANRVFRRAAEAVFHGCDLCRRIIGTGAEIHYVAQATIIHDEHASLNQVPRLTQRVYWEDLVEYVRKYHGRGRRGCWRAAGSDAGGDVVKHTLLK